MTKTEKDWIDNASYRELLVKLRQEPIGSSWFKGDTGQHFGKVIAIKRRELEDAERVAISKSVPFVHHEDT